MNQSPAGSDASPGVRSPYQLARRLPSAHSPESMVGLVLDPGDEDEDPSVPSDRRTGTQSSSRSLHDPVPASPGSPHGDPSYDGGDLHSSMHASDLLHSSPLSATDGRARLRERIEGMERGELDADDRRRIERVLSDEDLAGEELRDASSTALMDAFRKTKGRGTFGLLYELNAAHLLTQVAGRLRRYGSKADPGDVLQEVFFNVYRYPHRFDASREDAFRVWTAMIVRNTVLKHMRSRSTGGGRMEVAFEDLSDQPLSNGQTPLTGVLDDEANAECSRAYVVYLQLYIQFYSMLSDRERRALHLVEVDGVSYREAAADLEIKLENLKMVIFRARRKIHRAMRRVFDGLSPDCKPARVGRTGVRRGSNAPSPGPEGGPSPD